MRVLVIGQGGREHAIIRGLKLSPAVTEIHAIPGGPGLRRDAVCHNFSLSDSAALQRFARQTEISLVVVGPEAPLAEGIADVFRGLGIPVFGPNAYAAQLEASKVFAKEFMVRAGIPTARSFTVASVRETLEKAERFSPPYVLKADGLAAGKGVSINEDLAALKDSAEKLFERKIFGDAGAKALLEEFEPGWELSYLILTNGEEFEPLPFSQDHKRLMDGDKGPNTGGMGTVAPMKIDRELHERIDREIVRPCLKAIEADGRMIYRGVLFIGLMMTERGPKVIEFNVRFGDPETQVILPLLDGDWAEALLSVAQGEMPKLHWKPLNSACVVMAAEGYPDQPKKGVSITGDVFAETPSSYFLHAGTAHDAALHWVTGGGRVLNAVGLGSSLDEALKNSYRQAARVSWPGMRMRKDIGQKALKQK